LSAILAGVLPVFALIALGWSLKATRFIPEATWGPIERVTYFVFYPGFLIPTIWTAQFQGLSAAPLGAASIAAVLLIGGAAVLLRPCSAFRAQPSPASSRAWCAGTASSSCRWWWRFSARRASAAPP
jgi:predicted permease